MYKKDENLAKADEVEFLSIDDKIEISSNKSEYSKKTKNGQLNKCSVSKLIFQYSKRIITLILILLKIFYIYYFINYTMIFIYNLVNKNIVID